MRDGANYLAGLALVRQGIKRIFTTAIIDEDLQSGFSSVSYMPGVEGDEHEGWFIDPGTISERSVAAAAAAAVNRQSGVAR